MDNDVSIVWLSLSIILGNPIAKIVRKQSLPYGNPRQYPSSFKCLSRSSFYSRITSPWCWLCKSQRPGKMLQSSAGIQ